MNTLSCTYSIMMTGLLRKAIMSNHYYTLYTIHIIMGIYLMSIMNA